MIEKAMTCKDCGKPYPSFDGTQKDVCTCPVESINKLTGSKFSTDKEIPEKDIMCCNEFSKLNWKEIDNDDFMCERGDYCLRVEQMDINHWWWRVYFKGDPIPEPTNEYARSKHEAMSLAGYLYHEHLRKNSINSTVYYEKY